MKMCILIMTLTALVGLMGMTASGGDWSTDRSAVDPRLDDDYRLDWRTFDAGGKKLDSADGVFELRGTIGQACAGRLSAGPFTLESGFEFAMGTGDADGDGDFDLDDYAEWDACMRGPGEPGCHVFDMDGDGSVDLADFASFLVALSASP